MQIDFETLRRLLKSTNIPVYRDEAPTTADYPYIIYQFVNEQYKRASNKVMNELPLYQIAFITEGTESELRPLKSVLKNNDVLFETFVKGPYSLENDDRVTQYVTFVRCVE